MSPQKHILIVEDDTPIAEVLVDILGLEGYEDVEIATCAEDAVRTVDRRTPDLILLDYMLPDRNGAAFLSDLAQMGVREQIPVLLLTADKSAIATCGDMVEFALEKPFHIDTLLKAVGQLLAGELTVVGTGNRLR